LKADQSIFAWLLFFEIRELGSIDGEVWKLFLGGSAVAFHPTALPP